MTLWDVVSAGSERPVWPVGALLRAVADSLQTRFNPVQVQGEVSGLSRAASGHCYFTLKDEQGQIRCAWFRRSAGTAAADLREGQKVQVTGRLDVYGPRGDLQLVVEAVRQTGLGNLYEQFMRLKAELEAQGWFDPARKRALPAFPARIGVVTSLDAAALRDVVTTLRRRAPHVAVRVFPSPVQGDAAPAALCAALERAYAWTDVQGGLDAVLLVRGGGSLEDLWAFNDPGVVRTVARAPMPVIAGVGHETDVTLVDFTADLRAPTPTAAAELCAPSADQLQQALGRQAARLQQALQRNLDVQAQRVDRLAQKLGRPSERVGRERLRIQALAHRLQRAAGLRLQRERQRIEGAPQQLALALKRDLERKRRQCERAESHLALLDPALVLQRGYAWLTDAQGQVLTGVASVQAGDAVRARLADGSMDLTVTTVQPTGV